MDDIDPAGDDGATGPAGGRASDAPADRGTTRAELLPEEEAFEVQDPGALAEQVLRESDERTADPDAGRSGPA